MVGQIGTIFIIESLKDGELKTGSEIYNDILDKYYKYHPDIINKLNINLFIVDSKKEFFEVIYFIQYNCEYAKLGILLHLEMHAGKDGILLANDESVNWKELTEYLMDINLKICNQLYVNMASCYGRSIYKAVDIKKTSLYSGYISASKEVKAGEILDDYRIIYESLLKSHNLIEAYTKLESKNVKSKFYYKDTDEVFKELLNYTFYKIENDQNYKAELFNGIEKEMHEKGYEYDETDMKEMMKLVENDFRTKHYSRFTLKDCH